ncbi:MULTISPECIES: hypothetical protein [Paenibacillus]|uniref:hypothetical protein n=1 Tax=Paenibacillus TaxID=44249 RepID=UPI0002E1A928|nr:MULTISPECIES: hypothetical protein [Paenibacillus]KKD53936.1 hypothetical protein C400_16000 [Paenibacillus sp. ICGEB2008]
MSERTYKLLDGFILTEKNGRLYLHEGSNTPVPVPAPHTLIGDLLALVDSLQQQVAQLQEMDKLHTSGAKQLTEDLHTLREERDKFRKALSDVHNAARWGDLDRIEGIIGTALSE